MLGFVPNQPMTGINYSSPTVQYTMGGMYNNIPPNPIGGPIYGQTQPVMSPGFNPYSGGYMGGYYGGGYMMNPYAYQQQKRAEEAAKREQERMQSDILKNLSRLAHKSLGDIDKFEDFEEHLKQYDPVSIDNEAAEAEREYNKLLNTVPLQPNWNYIAYCNKVHDENMKRFPNNMSLFEYLEHAGELYLESIVEKSKQLSRDGKMQYDTDQYRRLLADHKAMSGYFNSALTGGLKSVNVDDMEIQLPNNGEAGKIVVTAPSHMQEYNARKAAFLAELMKNAATL